MPCRVDTDPNEERRELERRFIHNSHLAEVFCKVMVHLELLDEGASDPIVPKLPSKALHWWAEHKRRDTARIAHEQKEQELDRKRANALSKLTPEEQKILGVRTK